MSTARLGLSGDLQGKAGLGANSANYWDTNGVLHELPAGTAGQAYTTQGTGAAPTFTTITGGGGGGAGGSDMIGSAAFDSSSGSIAGLAMTGVVSGVTRTAAGRYTVSFTSAQADANYIVTVIASDDSSTAVAGFLGGVSSDYTTTGFKFVTATITNSPVARDAQVIRVGVYRYATSTAGSTVQVKNTQTGAVATGTTVIPMDDTIPQNTEGTEFMTLAITPTSATNKLKIEVVVHGNVPAQDWMIAALFQDSGANALAALPFYASADGGTSSSGVLHFSHYMTAGTTSATTFKVRAGKSLSGTFTFNGVGGSRFLGGVIASSITITEIAA